jgi:hypothetical protein
MANLSMGLQRPDLFSPIFKIEFSQREKLSPGYIFVGPYEIDNSGPFIFDNDGVCFSPVPRTLQMKLY